MAEEYSTLRIAVDRAIKDIETNDSHVTRIEIHGPHSGYEIHQNDTLTRWKCTPFEK